MSPTRRYSLSPDRQLSGRKETEKTGSDAFGGDIAYYETVHSRRTGTCEECGRLNDAASERCLCGGRVIENDLLEDPLGDPGLHSEPLAATSADSHRLLALGMIALLTGCGVWIGVALPAAVLIGLIVAGAWVAWLLATTDPKTSGELDL